MVTPGGACDRVVAARPSRSAVPTVPYHAGRVLGRRRAWRGFQAKGLVMLYRWQKLAGSNSSCQPWRMVVDRRKPHNHWLSRTLRARDNGAADTIRCLRGARRRATTRIKPTPGEKACGFLAFRGLSAAPLEVANERLTTLFNSTIVL